MSTYAALRDSLDAFLSSHLAGLENEERVEALLWYCQGLGLEIEGKTALGLATRLAPETVQATRQRMQRALARGRFDHDVVFARIRETVFCSGQMQAYCFDDTGIAKKGELSVGVQRQYSGTLGKVGNCQVIVSLHGVSDSFGACLGAELYLPKSWSESKQRRQQAKVPDNLSFRTKWEIALELMSAALWQRRPASAGTCRRRIRGLSRFPRRATETATSIRGRYLVADERVEASNTARGSGGIRKGKATQECSGGRRKPARSRWSARRRAEQKRRFQDSLLAEGDQGRPQRRLCGASSS